MGTLYSAICKDCRHEFEFASGPLMTCEIKVCDRCGESISVPHLAPAGSFELSKRGLRDYMQSEIYDVRGRALTDDELSNLEMLTRCCSCGGHMVLDDGSGSVQHRCPQCASANLETQNQGDID